MKLRHFVQTPFIFLVILTFCCSDDGGISTGPSDQVTLTIAVTPSGAGTTTPSAGNHDYDEDTVVTLIAHPASGYRFANWSGDVADTPNDTTTVVMSADRTVTANFTETTAPEITFITIPGGTFQMGNVENASEGHSDEKPMHSVTLTGFEMSIYEVTNAQYCMYLNAALESGDIQVTSGDVYGKTGSWLGQMYLEIGYIYNSSNRCWITYSSGVFSVTSGYANWPVVAVTWYGSKAFANYYGLDLPTESEWEYACRGGHQYKYGTDDGTISSTKANYNLNIGNPVNVVSYPANPYGLRDMSGNVMEWCHDWYGAYTSSGEIDPTGAQIGSYRVRRGGGWYGGDDYCRSASRSTTNPADRGDDVGFRVVRRVGGVIY